MNTITFNGQTLYCEGNIELLYHDSVMIMGTRYASPYGKWVSYEIAKHQSCIVSMLAEGCSAAAIEGALNNDCNVIVVLSTPLTDVFPKSLTRLQQMVAEKVFL